MSSFPSLPLGARIPNSIHAVSVSIPTMRDLRGYEEKKPEVLSRMPSGYPRFVVHPMVRRLADVVAEKAGLSNRKVWLTSSEKMAVALLSYLGSPEVAVIQIPGVHGVSHPQDAGMLVRAKSFLQHTGGFISGRQAEDVLVEWGVLSSPESEQLFAAAAARVEAERHLLPLLPGAGSRDLFFTSSGINAVYSAFRAIDHVQARRGRKIWVQLGWLYLDTIAILQKFTSAPECYRHLVRVEDKDALIKLFAEEGDRIAGVIAEVPTNPLIQTPDVPWLSELVHKHGAQLILDPSVASIYAVDLLRYADLLVASLTKYSAHEGEVLAGMAVVNPAGGDAPELRDLLAAQVEPLYQRDLCRLAVELGFALPVFARIEESVIQVIRYLDQRPEVKAVHWSRGAHSGEAFAKIARRDGAVGGLLSFELKVPLDRFYDAVRLPKGPSFGMGSSLLCPFIWMAHYDLVTSPEGRITLAKSGINPDLLRLSVGTEPADEIIRTLEEAFAAVAQGGDSSHG